MTPSAHAMGYGLHRGTDGRGTTHLQTSSLTATWSLKLGPPLCIPGTPPKGYLTCIFVSVLASIVPWCATWAGQLRSIMSWCQVAALSGYDHKHTAQSMHGAIQRVGDTIHSSDPTAAYVHRILHLLPLPRCCHVARVLSHVQRHAIGRGEAHSTGLFPSRRRPTGSRGPSVMILAHSGTCSGWRSHPRRLCVCGGTVPSRFPNSRLLQCPHMRVKYSSAASLFVRGAGQG